MLTTVFFENKLFPKKLATKLKYLNNSLVLKKYNFVLNLQFNSLKLEILKDGFEDFKIFILFAKKNEQIKH